MKNIKELALIVAEGTPGFHWDGSLFAFTDRLFAAYLAEQEPVFEVGFGWLDTLNIYPNGTKLFTAPPLPAIPDERIATLEQQVAELLFVLRDWDGLIQYNYSGSREAMSAMQQCAFDTKDILDKVKQP